MNARWFYLFIAANLTLAVVISMLLVGGRAEKSIFSLLDEANEKKAALVTYVLKRHLQDRITLLKQVAARPLLANSVMGSSNSIANLRDYLAQFRLLGEAEPIYILDIFGGTVLAENDRSGGLPVDTSAWLNDVLDEGESVVTLYREAPNQTFFVVAVPVSYAGNPEGVIVAVLSPSIEQIFGFRNAPDEGAIGLKGPYLEYFSEPSMEGYAEYSEDRIRQTGLTVTYYANETRVQAQQRVFMRDIGLSIFISLALSFGALLLSGRLVILNPYARLEKSKKEIEAAKRQNDLLAAAMQATPVGISISDPAQPDLPMTFVNPGFTAITGYSEQEVLGENCRFLQGPGTDPDAIEQIRQAIRDENEIRLELLNYRKDGTPFWNLLLISPVFDENSTLVAYVGVQQDVTERKRLDRMKDEFVSTVSHELRTPLTSIAGSLSLIVGGATGEVPEKAQKLLEIAQKNSKQLTLLINDLLDIEKISAGKLTLNMAWYDVSDLVSQAISANQHFGVARGVQVELVETPEQVKVLVDGARLHQVLSNLLSNAIKFSPDGETVEVRVARMQDMVRVTVSDNGPGIPLSFHDRLFKKFAQADASNTRHKGGTGLGLAISRELIVRMNGSIDFDSTEGHGATFWFDLPIVDKEL